MLSYSIAGLVFLDRFGYVFLLEMPQLINALREFASGAINLMFPHPVCTAEGTERYCATLRAGVDFVAL